MHTPELCNKLVKVTVEDRDIEVVEKGKYPLFQFHL